MIPAFNEEAHIAECLRGVVELDYPAAKLDIVVVDNGSQDATAGIALQAGVRVVDQSGGFVGGVRNKGAAASPTSEVLAFLDADCVPPPHWLAEGVALLESDARIGAVGGPCMARADATWLEQAWAQPVPGRAHEAVSLAASSLLVRRVAFAEVGGFDESMSAGEDDDLSRRLRAGGWSLITNPACAVYHLGWPKTLRQTYRRQRWQGANQLKATRGELDRNVILVHLFTIALFSAGVGASFAVAGGSLSAYWGIPVAVVVLTPLLASARRSRPIEHLGRRVWRTIQLYPVYATYYVGRMVGLLSEYASMLGMRTRHGSKSWRRH